MDQNLTPQALVNAANKNGGVQINLRMQVRLLWFHGFMGILALVCVCGVKSVAAWENGGVIVKLQMQVSRSCYRREICCLIC